MNSPTWITAFILSLVTHIGLAMAAVPVLVSKYAERTHQAINGQAQTMVFGFAIAWCVIAAVWSGSVARSLGSDTNRWGGIRGWRLAGIVAGLTLAIDLVNLPCFWTFPPIALVIPILSAVAIFNNSQPDENAASSHPPR